jgi:hypothetical protein
LRAEVDFERQAMKGASTGDQTPTLKYGESLWAVLDLQIYREGSYCHYAKVRDGLQFLRWARGIVHDDAELYHTMQPPA